MWHVDFYYLDDIQLIKVVSYHLMWPFVPDFVKGFCHIKIHVTDFKVFFIIKGFLNFTSKIQKPIYSGIACAETWLIFRNKIVWNKIVVYALKNYSQNLMGG